MQTFTINQIQSQYILNNESQCILYNIYQTKYNQNQSVIHEWIIGNNKKQQIEEYRYRIMYYDLNNNFINQNETISKTTLVTPLFQQMYEINKIQIKQEPLKENKLVIKQKKKQFRNDLFVEVLTYCNVQK